MTMLKQIEKEKQVLARCENALAIEKLKKRRADTRRKIEFGGLVIKGGIGSLDKTVLLGAFIYLLKLVKDDKKHVKLFETQGRQVLFKDKCKNQERG